MLLGVQLGGAVEGNITHGLNGLESFGLCVAAVNAGAHVLHDLGSGAAVDKDAIGWLVSQSVAFLALLHPSCGRIYVDET